MSVMTAEQQAMRNLAQKAMKGKVVVDFYADWCGPCQRLQPILERMSADHTEVTFLKVNVDYDQASADEFVVRSIPTVLFLSDGVEMDRVVGLLHEAGFREKLRSAFR